ncbi:MAG: TonB-dependent receptor [Acidobacteria bacterium]|nr:TonB-dependent receptor [Acidobacteriota bacterium]
MRISSYAALAVLLVCLASVVSAQIGTSTITGRVTDSTGAVVPNVQVTIVQTGTNFTSTAVTNSEGIYRVPSLQPGEFRVSFEAAGFKKAVREDVELRTGDTLAVDMTLQVGNVSESIEVTGATQLLETETSATGTVVSGNVLYDMPLYQRYINSTLNLVPGMTTGGYAYGGDLGSYHLAGQRNGAIGIFEDGVNGNDQQSGTATIKPLQNSVSEVKVLTTVPPAEYGHSAGGVISVVKKSGSNELHGMASWYGRTRMMQHRLFFDKLRTSQPTPGRPNGVPVFFMMPDGNISGPVSIPKVYNGKNKTFFFFGYQRLHEKKVAQVDATTPTLGMKQGDFNFPGVAANPIFDPASTRLVNGNWQRDAFAGNRIPLSRFDPVAQKVLSFDPWVLPNREGTYNALGPNGNLLADEFAKVFFDDYNVRLDHQFSSAFKIYGSYTENRQSGFGRPINVRYERPEFDHQQGNYSPFYQRNLSAGKTWVARPNLVNDARVGYYRRFNQTQVPSYNGNWAQQLGIPNVNAALMPAFGSGGRDSADSIYGLTGATPSRQVNETISFRNDTSWIRGTHAFKFGYELLRYRLNNAVLARPVQFSFAGVTAGLQPNGASMPNTGNTFAGFLTGYVGQALFQGDLTSWLPRSYIHSFYFQDDWKLTPTLTANVGVRYSNESPFNTKYGLMSNFDPSVRDDVTGRPGAIIHPTSGLNRRDNNNFNPRLGLAWHPYKKWVLRGGLGMYTVDAKFPVGRGQFDEYTAIANQQAAPGNPTPIYQISRGTTPPSFNLRSNGTAPFVGTNYGSRGVSWWDPNLRNPYTLNWNASIQYEMIRDYLVEVSYQGSSGVGLLERWETNTFPIDYAVNDPVLRNQVFAAPQNYRPNTHFGGVPMQSNFGHSSFHSGTVKVEKRMSRGLYFMTFYTFSKTMDSQDSDTSGSGLAPIQNRRLEKGRAGFDRNHRFIGVVNWALPFGKNKRWASGNRMANWILGGFELSWIQTAESGNPLTFSYANSPYNYYPTFAGNRRPDIVGKPAYDFGQWNNGGPDRFTLQNRPAVIDMAAFAYPGGAGCPALSPGATDIARCSFLVGNAGRGILTGPRLLWSQISAQKNFRIGERWLAQLRWDFQNALKTYNFTGPTTTVDFRNPRTFGRLTDDPRTASLGGQPLMNLTLMIQF